MPGQITLGGALTGGPPQGADLSSGRSLINAQLALKGGASAKPYGEATGVLARNLNSQTFVTLSGVGPTDTVTKGDTFYFFSNGSIDLQLTVDDGLGNDVLVQFSPDGLVVMEFNQQKFLKLIEAKGNGQVEYFASGPV